MKIHYDWHIHSQNSCDCSPEEGMTMLQMLDIARAKGIKQLGVTDHLHTRLQWPDIEAGRREFDGITTDLSFHFGIEVSCMSKWELDTIDANPEKYSENRYGFRQGGPSDTEPAVAITREDIERLGIEFVVAGTHWPMYVPFEREPLIRNYHRQNMFLATHLLVDVVAHPWWFLTSFWQSTACPKGEPWFDDFGVIPKSMHDEFAQAAVENNTAVEINIGAVLLKDESKYPASFKRQYLEYLAELKTQGVKLSVGSDAHKAEQYRNMDFVRAEEMLDSVGITEEDLWTIPCGK